MSRIYGSIEIDFETKSHISEEKFTAFKQALNKLVDEFDDQLSAMTDACGCSLSKDTIHAIMVDTDTFVLQD